MWDLNSSLLGITLPAAMKTSAWVALLLVLTGACHYNEHILVAAHDIPVAGTVLQRSDLRLNHGWTHQGADICLLPSQVLGHKTLRPLVKGEVVHRSDIETTTSGKLPNSCPENIADAWDSER